MDEWRTLFGTKFKEARNAVPLTQTEVAFLLKVGQTTVSAWERGVAIPRDELRPKIAHILRTTVAELFAYPDDPANGHDIEAA